MQIADAISRENQSKLNLVVMRSQIYEWIT